MNKRLWIVFAILVLASLGGLILWKKSDTVAPADTSSLDGSKLLTQKDVGDGQIPDHYIGKLDAKVKVIMYEDYACIHCNEFNPSADEIFSEYKDRVLFIYRNFSLSYPNSTISESAAEAAYLVGGNDAYWSMHRSLFSNTAWTQTAIAADQRKSLLTDYAKNAGIDTDKFFAAIDNYKDNGIEAKLNRDKSLGLKADVSSTPTWFIDGNEIKAVTESNVKTALDKALK